MWLAGRRGRADGRECHGKEDGGTVAESYREDAAGRSIVGELLAGAPWQSCWQGRCSEELSGRYCWPGRRGSADGWQGRCGRDTAARENHREEDVSGGRCGGAAGRQLQEGITTQKKRVTTKPSRTFWSPSLKIVPLC